MPILLQLGFIASTSAFDAANVLVDVHDSSLSNCGAFEYRLKRILSFDNSNMGLSFLKASRLSQRDALFF